MASLSVIEDEFGMTLTFNIKQDDGSAFNLTSKLIRIRFFDSNGAEVTGLPNDSGTGGAADGVLGITLSDPANGVATYTPTTAGNFTGTAGSFSIEFEIADAFPGSTILERTDSLSVTIVNSLI